MAAEIHIYTKVYGKPLFPLRKFFIKVRTDNALEILLKISEQIQTSFNGNSVNESSLPSSRGGMD